MVTAALDAIVTMRPEPSNDPEPALVTAAEIGTFAWCPEAARLAALDTAPNAAAQKRMAQGVTDHERWLASDETQPRAAVVQAGCYGLIGCLLAALALWLWQQA